MPLERRVLTLEQDGRNNVRTQETRPHTRQVSQMSLLDTRAQHANQHTTSMER